MHLEEWRGRRDVKRGVKDTPGRGQGGQTQRQKQVGLCSGQEARAGWEWGARIGEARPEQRP